MATTNRLAGEQSPYLLQHAQNPVDWYPWGEEAFARARAENKPIFLSIGYSTCHWCHVMEHESFENDEIARYLNQHFLSIKVDREERPDVDRIYMSFVQATTGSGGWPMSVWLTPELKPFLGGTYFPPTDAHGRTGFLKILNRIAEAWETSREALVMQSEKMTATIEGTPEPVELAELSLEPVRKLYDHAISAFDKEWAGFGTSLKFPRPAMLSILLRVSTNREFSNYDQTIALRMVRETLRGMARGGMHDHLGGGFHRYSVDRFWHVPHFEKMLYDQAQLAIAYLESWQRSSGGENSSRTTAVDILEYVSTDLLAPEGGFYSAEDADSLPPAESTRKTEGAFYVWTKAEIETALGEDTELVSLFYDVSPEGNIPEGSDPHGELLGQNVLYQKLGLTKISKLSGIPKADLEVQLERARGRLLAVRSARPRPHRDEKQITSWNGLMISAFARCGAAFGEKRYVETAARAAEFFLTQVLTSKGQLARSFCTSAAEIPAFADDYAFLIQGLLDLYSSTFDSRWLRDAARLQKEQDELFYDFANGGYYSTRADAKDLIARLKDDYDGAEPSANAISASNLLRLSSLLGDASLREQAELTLQSSAEVMSASPQAVPQMLVSLELALTPSSQLVLSGDPRSREFLALAREAWRRFLPHTALMLGTDCRQPMPPVNGRATAYLCENFACELPVTEPAALAKRLDS
ncbi:MAG TPA: thioredoxin domain-containing protein [Chthoniobacterales bacterium]|jgi:hypothetical protein